MLKLMPGGAKINYLCKGSNFTILNLHKKSRNKNTDEGASKNSDPVYGPYICLLYIFQTIFEYSYYSAERC